MGSILGSMELLNIVGLGLMIRNRGMLILNLICMGSTSEKWMEMKHFLVLANLISK